jgi:hypothetical protein
LELRVIGIQIILGSTEMDKENFTVILGLFMAWDFFMNDF